MKKEMIDEMKFKNKRVDAVMIVLESYHLETCEGFELEDHELEVIATAIVDRLEEIV